MLSKRGLVPKALGGSRNLTLSRPVTGTSRPIFPVTMYPGRAIPGRQKRVVRLGPMLVLEGELINPAHVPYWRVNNPTLSEFCFRMIGRADIEGSKSNVAMNAWLPQASYPCGTGHPTRVSPPPTQVCAGGNPGSPGSRHAILSYVPFLPGPPFEGAGLYLKPCTHAQPTTT